MTWLASSVIALVLALSSPSAFGQTRANLDVPAHGSTVSGIGLVHGWACYAQNPGNVWVSFYDLILDQLNNSPPAFAHVRVAYGTGRGDTASICGDSNNGFSFSMNWTLLHNALWNVRFPVLDRLGLDWIDYSALRNGDIGAVLTVDGRIVDATAFAIGNIPGWDETAFRRGAWRECIPVPNFPRSGETAYLSWQESAQNFVFDHLCGYRD